MASLRILLLKPTRYDEEGYPVQWWRAMIPAHTIAVVHGILNDAEERQVLGEDVKLEIKVQDEITHVVNHRRLLRWLKAGERAVVMMIGVQTSQFPRSVDLARPFIAAGVPVITGGFHVSGLHAMLPDWEPGLAAAREAGVTLYAGELEEGADELLTDIWNNELKPFYDRLNPVIDLQQAPPPKLHMPTVQANIGHLAGLDLGRGCPYLCSFCCIINVHGRRPRHRTLAVVESYLRDCAENGISELFINDDNFARNQNWEPLLDLFIRLREEEGIAFQFFIQVDTLASRIPGFVEKAVRAGCLRVFIGIESVHDDDLLAADKRQNKTSELQEMVLIWKRAGAVVFGTLIIGFPNDTPQRVLEDIRFLQREVAIDQIEFFILTPAPGSLDHQRLVEADVPMDEDFNRYDSERPVTDHAHMSREEWAQLYRQAWETFYTPAHLERILKRGLAFGLPVKEMVTAFLGLSSAVFIEQIHPLQSGFIRRRIRTQRRPGLPFEPVWRFYPRHWWRTLHNQFRMLTYFTWGYWVLFKVRRDFARNGFNDPLIEPAHKVTPEDNPQTSNQDI